MDKNEIRELMRIFDKSDITKLKIKEGDFSIELQKGFESNVSYASAPAPMMPMPATMPQVAPVAAASAPAMGGEASINAAPSGLNIKSPMVGTFYKSPSPGAAPFAKIGDVIRKGQPIAIIEAMKIMNELEAEFDCKILDILVEDGQPVEFDMPIFLVEKV
ncbi:MULTISPECIES: acetyl-CoA carboxylase biotin carboxyl carrier protein [unclassified Sulfurospirillum]|jgi:acetyl-CoA carboxylase biotin carboxyl carrier protein|uniref:acetyl-CoA carboxylase biotin carboxyl carrier protein n=1 Tax=unclassified Sulfurospirillum TaxID=2618290 RepID=UPI000543EA3E|nr:MULTISPECIES: acetyl-CoA carboxylase biotin carboxyl carrier protein [unclassified Sulfurospirillum]KHG33232.1 MAG: acetyl-CoA carboxylase [Sulfurospirillum sp. MES]MCD8543332.1 acetyl-CoA carboxylase biotin carboxyl carrier protein [Sulfurospirillum cavolei]MCP3652988.1 acetyl-CoA carboxylase biotin carboxyl carrier protein [Sulfurospirillum sp. DNRA8]MCR1811839.1 acetyl-CoA carboxylase biotin carboxyl carrier protein [Sulfurospirillum sp. DNRA8]